MVLGLTLMYNLAVTERLLVCPHCQGREIIRKGKRFRRLQTVPIFSMHSYQYFRSFETR